MRYLAGALLLAGCGPKLGPPTVDYGTASPMPMVHTSNDRQRWYAIVDTEAHGERLFFVDSGYAQTTCDDDFAGELGLEPSGRVLIRGVGGTTVARKAALPPMSMGGHRVSDFTCIVRDLNTTSSIDDPPEVAVAGVLGADLMRRFVTVFDPEQAQLSLLPPEQEYPHGEASIPLGVRGSRGPRFVLEARIEQHRGRWLMDTGANSSTIGGGYYGLEPDEVRENAWIGGTGPSGGSTMSLAFYRDLTLWLGNQSVDSLRMVHRSRSPLGFDLMGLDVLGHFAMTLDPHRRQLHLRRIERRPLPQWQEVQRDRDATRP